MLAACLVFEVLDSSGRFEGRRIIDGVFRKVEGRLKGHDTQPVEDGKPGWYAIVD